MKPSNITPMLPGEKGINAFLDAIFHDLRVGEHYFIGNRSVKTGRWPYIGTNVERLVRANPASVSSYFSIGSVSKSNDGCLRRTSSDFKALHCIVLDDVGSKVDVNSLEPSWVMETNANNYQYGYILDVALRDARVADSLIRAVYTSDLTDKGGGNVVKLMKLPYGINFKEEAKGFKTVLKMFDGERRYSVDELIDGWGLDRELIMGGGGGRSKNKKKLKEGVVSSDVRDELLEYLVAMGVADGVVNRRGFVAVDCPRLGEHTVDTDKGGYKPLGWGEKPDIRVFECFHSHGGHRVTTGEFLRYCVEEYGAPEVGVEGAGIEDMFEVVDEETGGCIPLPFRVASLPDVGINSKGVVVPKKTLANFSKFLEYHHISLWVDVIRKTGNVNINGRVTLIGDNHYTLFWSMAQAVGWDLKRHEVISLTDSVMNESEVNPVTDWLKSLPVPNDGVDWVQTICKTVDIDGSEAEKKLGHRLVELWLLQLVAAADGAENTPNKEALCKFESILVLCGEQGVKKSSWFGSLMPKALKEYVQTGATLEVSNKDSVMAATSTVATELGEIDSSFRKSDISHLKAFVSNGADIVRVPYGRVAIRYKRRTSFCGSVNDTYYLHDTTGNRRFFPVNVNSLELIPEPLLALAMSQLWQRYLGGECWWPTERWVLLGLKKATEAAHVDNEHPWLEDLYSQFGELTFERMENGSWLFIRQIAWHSGIVLKTSMDNKKLSVLIFKGLTEDQKRCIRRIYKGRTQIKMPSIAL